MTGESLGRSRRGRPPLLKEYADPMKSPMAHSSMQMQKAAATTTFTKPWMRVSVSGGVSPSQKKRRRDSGASSCSSIYSSSSSSSSSTLSPTQAIGKRNRHRGTILATPVKQHPYLPNSSPLMPADSVFSTEARRQPFRSSPLESSCGLSQTPPHFAAATRDRNTFSDSPGTVAQFSFSLCIGDDGKAKIAGTDIAKTPKSKSSNELTAQKPPLTGFDKSVVLGLLKKMKSSRKDSSAVSKVSVIRPSEVFTDFPPSSPKPSAISQPTLPWTPNCTAVFQLKTGFTPGNAIDEVLDPNPKQNDAQSQFLGKNRSTSAVFKMTSGDPLLLTDDDPSTDFLVSHGHNIHSTETFFQQLLSSPRKPYAYFHSPPSLLSAGSSRPQSKQDLQTSSFFPGQFPGEPPRSARGKMNAPTTPLVESGPDYSLSIQCTPLIQQAMSGSLNRVIGEPVRQNGGAPLQSPRALEQDDARLALRRLIGGSN
ncbi:LAME_0D01420g1_1 [Lachancea meyersii CBS 8951]|uniref:LAME_0D01420g1_1 n=1 Tax=Lachancea meyersii CBS 8951 TaxID=1266667 RepID=A0A1G4J792_9SACH|nr:LAME_0D01420g1_1 [Lachancea meyersii CBS 8951]